MPLQGPDRIDIVTSSSLRRSVLVVGPAFHNTVTVPLKHSRFLIDRSEDALSGF